eukprot:UN05472
MKESTFPLVFDRMWKSCYIDALLPAKRLGVPSITEIGMSKIPEIIKKNPGGMLTRVFRKSLTQLRFAQPVKMLEEIKKLQELLSDKSWDGGVLLKVLTKNLLIILDTEEFKRPISAVVLQRIKK